MYKIHKKLTNTELVSALEDFITGTVKTPYDPDKKRIHFDPYNTPNEVFEKKVATTPGDFLTNQIVQDITLSNKGIDGTKIRLVQDGYTVNLTVRDNNTVTIKSGNQVIDVKDNVGLGKVLAQVA